MVNFSLQTPKLYRKIHSLIYIKKLVKPKNCFRIKIIAYVFIFDYGDFFENLYFTR